jgi:Fe2+ transport system protein FeoA
VLTVDEVVGRDGPARRLGELGVCVGRSLEVVRGGDPAIVEIDGSRLALSGDLQRRIFVRPRS